MLSEYERFIFLMSSCRCLCWQACSIFEVYELLILTRSIRRFFYHLSHMGVPHLWSWSLKLFSWLVVRNCSVLWIHRFSFVISIFCYLFEILNAILNIFRTEVRWYVLLSWYSLSAFCCHRRHNSAMRRTSNLSYHFVLKVIIVIILNSTQF